MLGRREFARDTYVDDARPGYHEPYGHDNLDLVDDALILSGLADVLEPLPSLATKT